MPARYVVFYTKGNKNLGDFLESRAHELGYIGTTCGKDLSVTLDRRDHTITHTSIRKAHESYPADHELGNFEDFLTTDRYKLRKYPEIVLGGHKVIFQDDGIQVGCQTVNKATIMLIAAEYAEQKQRY